MEIWFYYFTDFEMFHPGHAQMAWDEMKQLGCSAVILPATEPDIEFFGNNVKRYIDSAKKSRLKVYWIPARYGGLFAGAPLMSSPFCTRNLNAVIKNEELQLRQGRSLMACVNNPLFQEFFVNQIEKVIGSFGFDGIMMDEPKWSDVTCYCDYCRAKAHGKDMLLFRQESMAEFLDMLGKTAKQVNNQVKIALFVEPSTPRRFAEFTACLEHIDVFGYDGSLGPHTIPGWSKEHLFDVWPFVDKIAKANGKKSLLVAENFDTNTVDLDQMEKSLRLVCQSGCDILTLFYYPFGNSEPGDNMERVKRVLMEFIG